MNLNDTGLIVNYINALLYSYSPEFRNNYHVDNYYSSECHRFFCNYYKRLENTSEGFTKQLYSDMLSMMNFWTGYFYDESESKILNPDSSWFIFPSDHTRYRCFIIPITPEDITIGYFTSDLSYRFNESCVYRFTDRSSIYKICTDFTKKDSNHWSDVYYVSSLNRKLPDTGTPYVDCKNIIIPHGSNTWKYLIVGIPITLETSNIVEILITRITNISLIFSIFNSYNQSPWIINDEIVPFILNRCITPISSTNDIEELQKKLELSTGYKEYVLGKWDHNLQMQIKKLSESSNMIYKYGYLDPDSELQLDKNYLISEAL